MRTKRALLAQLARGSARRCSPCPSAGRRRAGGCCSSGCRGTARGPRCPRARACSASLDLGLEVAVGAAVGHRAERAHAAVDLVRAALVEDDLAGRLVGAGEERADHHASRAGGERLGDVARVLDAAVGDDRDAVRGARPRAASRIAVICGTPTPATTRVVQIEPGPMPTFTAVGAGLDQRLGALGRRDVAADDRQLGEVRRSVARPPRARPSSGRARCRPRSRRRRRRPAPARARACRRRRPTAAPQRSRPSVVLAAFG